MSQAKVEKYKQEKANRKKIMAQEKRKKALTKLIIILIIAALVVWAAFSIRNMIKANADPAQTYINMDAITDYLGTLNAEE